MFLPSAVHCVCILEFVLFLCVKEKLNAARTVAEGWSAQLCLSAYAWRQSVDVGLIVQRDEDCLQVDGMKHQQAPEFSFEWGS